MALWDTEEEKLIRTMVMTERASICVEMAPHSFLARAFYKDIAPSGRLTLSSLSNQTLSVVVGRIIIFPYRSDGTHLVFFLANEAVLSANHRVEA